jgi:uncharacterized protein YcfL
MKNLLILVALSLVVVGCGSSDETAATPKLEGTVSGTAKPNDGGEAAAHAQREANQKAAGGAAAAGDSDKEMSGM